MPPVIRVSEKVFYFNIDLLQFAISAFIVLLIEIALVTWISTQRPDYADSIRNFLIRSFNSYNIDKRDRSSWNRLQRQVRDQNYVVSTITIRACIRATLKSNN